MHKQTTSAPASTRPPASLSDTASVAMSETAVVGAPTAPRGAHLSQLQVGVIASQLAHEIAQPLGAISNYAAACQAVLESGGEESRRQARQWLGSIAAQAQRAGESIELLRCLARRMSQPSPSECLLVLVRESALLVQRTMEREAPIPLTAADAGGSSRVPEPLAVQQLLIDLLEHIIRQGGSPSVEVLDRDAMLEVCLSGGRQPASGPAQAELPPGARQAAERMGGRVWSVRGAGDSLSLHLLIPRIR